MCGCFGNMDTCIYCVLYSLYCFVYVYLFLFVLSVLVYRLLPPGDNSIAVSNNNNNNNNNNNDNNKYKRYMRIRSNVAGHLNLPQNYSVGVSVLGCWDSGGGTSNTQYLVPVQQ